MSKRSDFERIDKDYYRTIDEYAYPPLLKQIRPGASFAEPMCGVGDLIHHTAHHLKCYYASDIERRYYDQDAVKCALTLTKEDVKGLDYIITNPVWSREMLHKVIDHFRQLKPTWLLFDADWAHTEQKLLIAKGCKTAPELLKHCRKIVSVGRLRWIPGTKMKSKDNCCWYLFDKGTYKTEFIGRN